MLYDVAPDTASQAMVTLPFPGVAVTPVGTASAVGAVGAAEPPPPPPQPVIRTELNTRTMLVEKNILNIFIASPLVITLLFNVSTARSPVKCMTDYICYIKSEYRSQ